MATIVISDITSFLVRGRATDLTWQVLRLVYGCVEARKDERQKFWLFECHLFTRIFYGSAFIVDLKEFLHLRSDNGPLRVNFRFRPATVIIAFKGYLLFFFQILSKLRVYEEHWRFKNLFNNLNRFYVSRVHVERLCFHFVGQSLLPFGGFGFTLLFQGQLFPFTFFDYNCLIIHTAWEFSLDIRVIFIRVLATERCPLLHSIAKIALLLLSYSDTRN